MLRISRQEPDRERIDGKSNPVAGLDQRAYSARRRHGIGRSAAPLMVRRWRSPTKLTLVHLAGKARAARRDDGDRFRAHHREHGAPASRRWRPCRSPACHRAMSGRRAAQAPSTNIGGADEFGDEAARRREIDVTRRTDLRDRAFAHDHDAVAERHGFGLVVGDIDRGDAERAQQPVEFAAQPVAQRRVERGERLVEQSTLGRTATARASATRWRWPPESWSMRRCSSPSMPVSATSSAMRALRSLSATPRNFRP